MTARIERSTHPVPTRSSVPCYEIRIRHHGPGDSEFEIWQLPSPASPHLSAAVRVAGLLGRNLELVEHRVLKHLAQAGVRLGTAHRDGVRGYAVNENLVR